MGVPYGTIGEFIAECSELERVLYFMLKKLTKPTPEWMLAAMIGNPRTSDLITILRNLSRSEDLAEILTAASFVSEIRAVVAHKRVAPGWGADICFEYPFLNRSGASQHDYRCTEPQLRACITYCGQVTSALLLCFRGVGRQQLQTVLLPALREKLGLPPSPNQQRSERPPKPRRRPRASP